MWDRWHCVTLNDVGSPLTATVAGLELARIVLEGMSSGDVLTRAAEVAKRTVPGAVEVSVTLADGEPVTVTYTGALAVAVDETQFESGYGPSLDAIRLARTILVDDLESEDRWPNYSPRALRAGVRSSVSVPLSFEAGRIGGFNVYGLQPHAFDADAVLLVEELAGYAGMVLNNAHLYFSAADRADQMAEAMRSRAVIEQAKGVVMATRGCSADEAFSVLVKNSQKSGRKLHLIARTVVDDVTRVA